MDESEGVAARMDQHLVIGVAVLVVGIFVLLIVYQIFRRRRLRARSRGREPVRPAQPNFFKRTAGSFRELRRELERRDSRKPRRRDRHK